MKQTNLRNWKVKGSSDESYSGNDSYHLSDEEDLGMPEYWTRVRVGTVGPVPKVLTYNINKDLKDFQIQERRRGDNRLNGSRPYFDIDEFKGTGYQFSKEKTRLSEAELFEVAKTVSDLRLQYRERSYKQWLLEQPVGN